MGERGQKEVAEGNVVERIEAVPEGRGEERQEVVHGRRPFAVAGEALRDVILNPDVHSHVPVVQRCVDIRGQLDIQDVHTNDFVP